jgi:hypothetical protein
VWHDKDPSLLKGPECRSYTGNGDSRQIAEKLLVRLKTNKQKETGLTAVVIGEEGMLSSPGHLIPPPVCPETRVRRLVFGD